MKHALCMFLSVILHGEALAEAFGDRVADYAPYLNGQPWPKLPVVTYNESKSNIWAHPTSGQSSPTIRIDQDSEADFSTIILRCSNGRVFKTYCDSAPSPFSVEVYSGDFNNDGVPDFMLVKPGSGCGLAAEYSTGVFAFSEGDTYRFTRVRAMGLGVHSLAIDPQTRSFRLIQSSFRTAMSSDNRYHSFWVHRFFEWNGVGFCSDSKLSPIWIQYLNRPNHEPTKLLTPKLKAEAWTENSDFESSIEW